MYLIRSKEKGLKKLAFNPAQKRIIQQMNKPLSERKPIRRMDIKARQIGASTLFGLFYLDNTIFHPNTISCIFAHSRESLNYLWEIIRFAHSTMPDSIKPKLTTDSASQLTFENNSKIMVSLRVQSTKIDNAHFSEYAYCEPREIALSIGACTPKANITLESTANGMNHAYEKWNDPDDGYAKMFHPWFLQPEYIMPVFHELRYTEEEERLLSYAKREYGISLAPEQIQYRRFRHKEYGHLALQELAEDPHTCFISTGNSFFNNAKVEVLVREATEFLRKHPPQMEDDEMVVFEAPQEGHVYTAGADVAEGGQGKDSDYSVLAILCVTCKRQAFRWRARYPWDKFHQICDEWGRKYNNALLAVEDNSVGKAIIMGLKDMTFYPNLYFEEGNRFIAFGENRKESIRKYGFHTDEDSKVRILSKIKLGIEGEFNASVDAFDSDFAVLDLKFLHECFTFRNENGKLSAVSGQHDDLVMAWAIAYEMYGKLVRRPNLEEGLIFGKWNESSTLFPA